MRARKEAEANNAGETGTLWAALIFVSDQYQ